MVNMLEQVFIKGVDNANVANGYYIVKQLKNITITPKGIVYLYENSLIEKAKQFLKDVMKLHLLFSILKKNGGRRLSRLGQQTPNTSLILPYTKTYGNEAV